tara:strand:- start:602 stop:4243 length:3642 start_codon:yes stop_codon:yes gene_type:complete
MYAFNKIQRKELQDEYLIQTKPLSNIVVDNERNIDLIQDISLNSIQAEMITVKTLNFGGDIVVTNTYNTLVDTDNIIVNDQATMNDLSVNDIQAGNVHSDAVYGDDLSSNTFHTNTSVMGHATISDGDILCNTFQANNADLDYVTISAGDKICIDDISANKASFDDLSANNALFLNASILSGQSVYVDDISANKAYFKDLSIDNILIDHATITSGDNIVINEVSANYISVGDSSINTVDIQKATIYSGDITAEKGAIDDLSVNTLRINEKFVTENLNLEYTIPNDTNVAYMSLDTSSNVYLWSENATVTLNEIAVQFTRTEEDNNKPIKFQYPIKSFAVDNNNVIIGQPTIPGIGHTGQVTLFDITFSTRTNVIDTYDKFGQSVDIHGVSFIVSALDYVFLYTLADQTLDMSFNITGAEMVRIKNEKAICYDGTNIHYMTKTGGTWSIHSSIDYSAYMSVTSLRDDAMAFDGDIVVVSNESSIFIRDLHTNTTLQQIDEPSTSFYLTPYRLATCDYVSNVITTYSLVDTSYVFDVSFTGISEETGKRGVSMNNTGTVLSVSNQDGLQSYLYKWYKNTWNYIETIVPVFDSIDVTILNVKCLPEVSSFATDIDNGNLIMNENEIRSIDVIDPLPNEIFAQYLIIFNDTSTNLVETYTDYEADEVIDYITDISADTIFETNYTDSVYKVERSTIYFNTIEQIIPTNRIFPDYFIIYKDSSTNLLGSYDPDMTKQEFKDTVFDISADAVFANNNVDNTYTATSLYVDYPEVGNVTNLVTFASNKIVPKRFLIATNPLQSPVENFYTFIKEGNDKWDLEMSYISDISYGLYSRDYSIRHVPETHPICLLGDFDPLAVSYTGTYYAGQHESGANYVWGTVTISVSANFNYFNIHVKDVGSLNSPAFIYTTQCFDTTVLEEGEVDADVDMSYNISNTFLFNDNHQLISTVKNFGTNKYLIKYECDERAIRDDVDKKLYSYDVIRSQDVMSVVVDNGDPSSNHIVLYNETFDVSHNIVSTEESILKRFDFASIGGYNKDYNKDTLSVNLPLSSDVDELQIIKEPENTGIFSVSKSKVGNVHFIDKITVDGTLKVNSRVEVVDGSFTYLDVSENLNVYGSHNISSDVHLKTNIEDISGLDMIHQLNPKKYLKNGNQETGFIAQDVLNTDVSFAVTDTNPLLLNYNTIFTYGIKAIQELNDKIILLTEQNALLHKKIEDLSK